MWLSNKLLGQGYVKERLRSSLRKFYDRYGDLIKKNMSSPSPECYTPFWMMSIYSDIFYWSGIKPILNILLILTLLPNVTFYLIARGFNRTFASGAACQQRTLTPPDTWSCSTLGLASFLMLIPMSPALVLFRTFEFRTSLGTSIFATFYNTASAPQAPLQTALHVQTSHLGLPACCRCTTRYCLHDPKAQKLEA